MQSIPEFNIRTCKIGLEFNRPFKARDSERYGACFYQQNAKIVKISNVIGVERKLNLKSPIAARESPMSRRALANR